MAPPSNPGIEARMQAIEHRLLAVEHRTDDLSGQNVRVEGKVDSMMDDVRDAKRGLARVELDTLHTRTTLQRVADKVGVRRESLRNMRAGDLQEDEEDPTLQRIERLKRTVKADSRRRESTPKKIGRVAGYSLAAIMAAGVAFREVRGMVQELVGEIRGAPTHQGTP